MLSPFWECSHISQTVHAARNFASGWWSPWDTRYWWGECQSFSFFIHCHVMIEPPLFDTIGGVECNRTALRSPCQFALGLDGIIGWTRSVHSWGLVRWLCNSDGNLSAFAPVWWIQTDSFPGWISAIQWATSWASSFCICWHVHSHTEGVANTPIEAIALIIPTANKG